MQQRFRLIDEEINREIEEIESRLMGRWRQRCRREKQKAIIQINCRNSLQIINRPIEQAFDLKLKGT